MQPLPPHRVAAEALDDDVDGEAVQPGRERGVAAKRSELLPDAHEDVLREFVGVAAAGHPPDEAVHARQVRAIDLFERPHVPRRGAGHVRERLAAGTESAGDRSANASKLHPYTSLDGRRAFKGWNG